MPSLREKTAFYLEDTETSLGLAINLIVLGLILLSSGIFVAQTYPLSPQLTTIFHTLDLIILFRL